METSRSEIEGPIECDVRGDVEAILRSLPMWFGREEALLHYVQTTTELPTFVLRAANRVTAFLTVKQYFAAAWEVYCVAVHADSRNQGRGRALLAAVEAWLVAGGARLLQVKTMAASSGSPEYELTRGFYVAQGFLEHEEFPLLWGADLPCLQMVKVLEG